MAKNGLHLITPTSVSGTGLSITANGSVTMSGAQYVTINGVFSADYDNYMAVLHADPSALISFNIRVASGGTGENGSNYTTQNLYVDDTTVGTYLTTTTYWVGDYADTTANGTVWNIYGPYLAQQTAIRTINASSRNGVYINDIAGTHSLSNSYDGLYFWAGNTFSGRVAVYGMRK